MQYIFDIYIYIYIYIYIINNAYKWFPKQITNTIPQFSSV